MLYGTAANFNVTISGLSPAAGDEVGFYCPDFAAATRQYILDAGGTVKVAGRTRYLALTHTNVVLLRWDGTDWQPLVLNLDSPWVRWSGVTIDGTTTGPTKGTTSIDDTWWSRKGDSMHIQFRYRHAAGGADGSGDYLVGLPLSIDTAVHPTETTVGSITETYTLCALSLPGSSGFADNGSATARQMSFVIPYSETQVRLAYTKNDNGGTEWWRSNNLGLGTANFALNAFFTARGLYW